MITTVQIINAFYKLKQCDPKRFYDCFGYNPDEIRKHPLYSGSYDLGLVVGAKYALEHWVNEEPLNNQGGYEVNAELKRPISGAELKEVLDAAPKYPAGGHTAPKPEGNPVEQAISNGFAAVCAVLRYGYQQVEKAVNLCDERLDPGIVWNGRLFYLVEDVENGSACEQCGIRTLCERLTEYDEGPCEILSGNSNHHFAEVH